jgi:DNA polymerase elongation subunit (family B)
MYNPRSLVLDIETTPMEAFVWGRRDVNIDLSMVKKDWQIMAWSAKWLGEKKVYYKDTRNAEDDAGILFVLKGLLDEADIVITQNGQSFDIRKINARLIFHGMQPPSPYRHIDTYRFAKSIGDFTSNSLEYLTDKLCVKYKKLKHLKFPGITLWKECLNGNPQAWEEMKRYNIHDTLATEELYMKLRAWMPEGMPKPHSNELHSSLHCATCDYKGTMVKWGFYRTNKGIWKRYSCPNCGAFSKGDKI